VYPGPVNCSDRVSVDGLSAANEFVFDGRSYRFSIVGFQVDGTLMSDFITTERASNEALLLASITELPAQVPEPFTLGLLGAGLIGIAAGERLRRARPPAQS
jgi:hypothetical protein